MLQHANDAEAAVPELRVFRPENPYVALGLAVNHLMTKPAFANLGFGEASHGLVAQIDRKHYLFVLDSENQIQGFLGWAVTTKDGAEAWIQGRAGPSHANGMERDCIIIGAWAASSPKVNRFLIDQMREIGEGKAMLYFKRHYNNGSTRDMRLRINDFVERHIERARRSFDPASAS